MAVSPGLPVITTLSQFPVTGGTGMPLVQDSLSLSS